MPLNDEVETLRKVPLFRGIEPAKLKLLAFTSERTTFEAGQYLMRQGEDASCAFLILEGEAEITREINGQSVFVAALGANNFVGEMAILMDQPRSATVCATSQVCTLKITKDCFFQLIDDFPRIAIELMRVLAHRLETTTADLIRARSAGQTTAEN